MKAILIYISFAMLFLSQQSSTWILPTQKAEVQMKILYTQKTEGESTLLIDSVIANRVNSQAKSDPVKKIVFLADSIVIAENIRFDNLNIVFVANYFNTGAFSVTILPLPVDTAVRGANGTSGKEVEIIAKEIEVARFYLPGYDGVRGTDGSNGRSGNKIAAKERPIRSSGSAGGNGGPGGKGGAGGQITLKSMSGTYELELKAPGGKPGAGGNKGKGGITYIGVATKKTENAQPDGMRINVTEEIEKDGKRGKDGLPGKNGTPAKKRISETQFESLASEYLANSWESIKTSGWQILSLKK